jgi:cell surface protein SprA
MGGRPGGRSGSGGGRFGGGRGGRGGGGGGSPKPWSLENFSVSYAFTETDHTDPLIELDNTQNHTASLNYQFGYKPLYIEPFKKLIKNDKYLKFIKEIHINPLPNSFGFSTVIDRYINVRRYRFSNPEFSTWFDRRFSWDRTYTLSWDITRSLRFNFNATHFAMIDELDQNGVDFKGDTISVEPSAYRWNNFKDLGRPKNYDHNMVLSYNVPLRNFPFLDFIDLRAQVSANYNWAAAPINIDSLGNNIQNGQQRQINATFNLERLYNKSRYLRSLNKSTGGRSRPRGRQGQRGGRRQRQKDNSGPSSIEKLLIRPLMSLRRFQFNWTENYSSSVPGFMPETEFLGLSEGFEAPGWSYVLGFQPTRDYFFESAEEKGWFTASQFLSQEVVMAVTENWNAELNIEPWNDFRIDITMDRSFNQTSTALFKNIDAPISDPYNDFRDANYGYAPRNDFGSYTVSYMALNTLFSDGNAELINLFNSFEENRPIISQRLNPNGEEHDRDPSVYRKGYGRKQQEVLIPAFLSAYTGENPENVNLDLFNTTPRPNWSVNWNGLSRISFLQPIFRNIRISHAYKGSMSVNSFQRNAAFDEDAGFNEEVNFDEQANLYSRFVIPEVVIDERFNPLIGIDIQTQNDIQMNFKMSRARNLALSFTDTKLFETNSFEYTFGFGYTLNNVSIGFLNFGNQGGRGRSRGGGRQGRRNTQGRSSGPTDVGNRLTINLNFSYRDDVTFAYEIDNSSEPVPTRGTETLQINPSVDYDVNKNITLRLFLDYNRTIPKTSLAFPITNARGGINVRFNLN